ncbi:hypothetical protein HPB49_019161 [Dermacentor silvarum]|uniref:Uncharacterized protein n=1 Tax=Dermacentor silvarum TaxID=543639 RepID=A0ACB8CZB4_DERSI|nr:hypothetical protein HPB49_019161 [Dermacentor silvarum]
MTSPYNPPSEEDSSRGAPRPPAPSKKAASLSNTPCGAYDSAAEAVAVAGIKGRQRSLRGVGGERRDLAVGTKVTELPSFCPGGASAVGDELRRTDATTSLQRLAQRSPGRTCLVFTSVLIFLGVVLAALSLAMFTRNASRVSNDSARHMEIRDSSSMQVARCSKEVCRRMGSLLKDAVDARNDPCDDFYAYVCGSWPTKHPGQSMAQVLTSAFLNNVSRRAKAVRIPYALDTRKQTAVQKAARHLVACDDIVAQWDDQSAYVAEVLAEGRIALPDGGVDGNASSESDVLESVLYMSRVVKIPVLLEVTVESGPKTRVVIRRPENVVSLLAASTRRIKNMTFEKYENNNCTSDALERSATAYTSLFRRTRPEYFEDVYESYPDMTLSAVTNWIRMAPYVSARDERYGYDSFGDAIGESLDSAWRLDVEASYLDAPWYALGAPSAIKIAGIGSRVVGRLFSELVLNKRACKKALLTETEVTWRCMADTLKEQSRDAGDIKTDVVSAMLIRSILWETFRIQAGYRMNETVLENYPDLSESALFFVFGCIWSCGEDRDVARTRCNLPLMHDVNFAETFSCATGSPMRPEVQCSHAFSATALD